MLHIQTKHLNILYDGNGTQLITEDFFLNMMAKYNKSRVLLAISRAKRNYNKLPHHSSQSSS